MDDIINKWKNDSKYRAKMQLLLYSLFVVLVAVFVAVKTPKEVEEPTTEEIPSTINEDIIKITDKMNYQIKVNINDTKEAIYKIEKNGSEERITKEYSGDITNYALKDNEFYKDINGILTKVSKNDIYDILDYDYLKLDNINVYLSKAKKSNNDYLVYLKDIILSETESSDYFVIMVDNEHVSIDYTPLMKLVNKDIDKCKVNITFME